MNKTKNDIKAKGKMPVLAICYDFDKTLSPNDMQAQGYIQSIGYENTDDFWQKSNELAKKNDMDQNLAYMYQMKKEAEGALLFTKKTLIEQGSKVSLFPGVEGWFSRVNEYGKSKGIKVEHYIISSGLKEMIEGTKIADEFERIYASSFYFNKRGVAEWPAQVVNYTNKTQFLFRIEKGVLDVNDPSVNDYFKQEEKRIPFRNIVYIGDSDTDIPCMKLVNSLGGHSIGVYDPTIKEKAKVYKMMREGRIKYFAEADYNEGTEIDKLIKMIIDKTLANERLETFHNKNQEENDKVSNDNNKEEINKNALIIELMNSFSFANTHIILKKISLFTTWTDEQKEKLCEIAINNSQVRLILKDDDVRSFFDALLEGFESTTENVTKVKSEIG